MLVSYTATVWYAIYYHENLHKLTLRTTRNRTEICIKNLSPHHGVHIVHIYFALDARKHKLIILLRAVCPTEYYTRTDNHRLKCFCVFNVIY